MLKILQARFQQYVNWELPGVQAGFRKGRGTRSQITIIHWIIGKPKESQKNIYFGFIDYTTAAAKLLLLYLTMPKPLTCESQQTVQNS